MLGLRGVNGFAAGLSTYFLGPVLVLFSPLLPPPLIFDDVGVVSIDEI